MAAAHAVALACGRLPLSICLESTLIVRSSNRVRYMPFFILGAVPFVFLQSGIQSVLIPPFDDVQQKYLAGSFHAWLETVRAGFADQIFIYITLPLLWRAMLMDI
jgi:hypothetical protein